MTTGKNQTKICFVINMNLVLESFKIPSEARDLNWKIKMFWPENNGLRGFLFKFIVSHWASNGLLFEKDHLKPVSFAIWKLKDLPKQFICKSLSRSPWYKDTEKTNKQMFWPQNDGLLGFLFKPIV